MIAAHLLGALLAAALAQPSPAASATSPAPAPAPQSTTTPVPAPSPQASGATSLPVPTGPSTPTPVPVYNFVYRATPSPGSTPFPELDAPEILEVDVNDQTIAAPGPLHVKVITSDSVVTVVAASFGYEFSIPKVGLGLFKFDAQIPSVPDTVRNKRFDVDLTATSKSGRVTRLTLPFMLK